jgi:protein TonB
MDKRFSFSVFLSVALHLIVLISLSEAALPPTGRAGAGEKTRLVGVMQLQQSENKETNKKVEENTTRKEEAVKKNRNESPEEPAELEKAKKEMEKKQAIVPPGEKQHSRAGENDRSARSGSGKNKNAYLETIMKKIEAVRRYPPLARRRDFEGTARIKLTVKRSGRLKKSNLIQSSGYKLLDAETLKTINRAVPLPPFPADLDVEQLTVIIPIKFKLN